LSPTTLALSIPLKLLNAQESGHLLMRPGDYRRIACRVRSRLDALGTWELIELAHSAEGLLGEMAETTVFDRACCLVLGDRGARLDTEQIFESLMGRLLDPRPAAR
jgi:hypothetical protein